MFENISHYFVEEPVHELNSADYLFIGGDFNFGDESEMDMSLIRKLFLDKGFTDLCPNVCTFDPLSNFTAAITSKKNFGRRLDRILFKVCHLS